MSIAHKTPIARRSRAASAVPVRELKKVWKNLSLADWKTLLDQLGLGDKWTIRGTALNGCCPFQGHVDSSPSAWVRPSDGFVKCFGCGQYESNPVAFLAKGTGASWASILTILRKQFNLDGLPRKVSLELQAYENYQSVKNEIAALVNNVLVEAAESYKTGTIDKKFHFAQPCLDYLKSRGIPLQVKYLRNLPLGVLPPVATLKEALGKRYEASVTYLKQWLTADYIGSLVFFYHASPTELAGFRLRADFLRVGDKKDIVKIADDYHERLGYFGLSNYLAKIGRKSSAIKTEAIVMEGEFDVIATLVNNIREGKFYDITVSVGGAGEAILDDLAEYGIDRCLLLADHPDHNGDTIVHNLLKSNSMPMQVFRWPHKLGNVKDPDEAIQVLGWETWAGCLLETTSNSGKSLRRTHFQYPHRWALDRVYQALDSIDSDDITASKAAIADLGACLRDPDEQRRYATEVAEKTSLPIGTVFELIIGREETEEGYINRIIQALKDCYHFIGVETASISGVKIHAWHRKRREVRVWSATRASEMFAQLGVDLGSMINWARFSVGVPDWMSTKRVGKLAVDTSLLEQNNLQRKYMEMAIEEILRELPDIKRLQELKAGSHYIELSKPGSSETERGWAVVNGNSVYLGRYSEEGDLVWAIVDGPRIGPYYFNIIRDRWSNELTGVSDLYDGLGYDIQEAYDFIVSAINKGWSLRNQMEDCEYLAAALMINPISSAMPRQLYTILNGSRGSGKSTLLSLIAGSFPEVRILEAAFSMDSYTVAGFRKEMNGCALGACLDEFEDTGDTSQSRHVREILRDVRGLTSSKECRVLRGNVESTEATSYTLKCQLWVAAIQYLRDEADISRFVQIHTELEEGRASPTVVMLETFGEEVIRKHRRTLTLGMFRYVPQLLDNVRSLRKLYSNPEVMQALSMSARVEVPSRFLDGVIIPAAMVQLVGRDPHDFIFRFVKAKASYLSRIVKSTHKNTLLGHILSARIEFKRLNTEARHTTIRSLLSDPTDRLNLGEADCGARYLEFIKRGELHRWLIVIWPDAIHGVLRGVPLYRGETAARLKQLADSDRALTISRRDIRLVPGGMKKHLKPGIQPADYTVYDISEMLDVWDSPEKNDK